MAINRQKCYGKNEKVYTKHYEHDKQVLNKWHLSYEYITMVFFQKWTSITNHQNFPYTDNIYKPTKSSTPTGAASITTFEMFPIQFSLAK